LEDKTPEEEFTSVKPEVSHFYIFGYPFYIHVVVGKRTKLDPSSRKGFLVGYSETSKDYMIFIQEQRKTIVSMNVNFEEEFTFRNSRDPTPVEKDEDREDTKVDLGSPMISRETQQP
jgi:hypothetical protein